VITSKNKKRITIFILILLIASIYYFVEESSKYQFKGYADLVAIATDADISKFNTKTKGTEEQGKELIAVEFNNVEGNNIGFIDEYGNVILEPVYQGKLSRSHGYYLMQKFYGEYYYIEEQDVYINRSGEYVELTEEEKEEYAKLKEEDKLKYEVISIYDKNELADIVKTKFGEDYFQVACNTNSLENFCIFNFSAGFMKVAEVILNIETLEGVTFVRKDSQMVYILPPYSNESIGIFHIENEMKVYFKMSGEILWITKF